jgi:hypothetical protein
VDNGAAARHRRASWTVTTMCSRLQGYECDCESDLMLFDLSGTAGIPYFTLYCKAKLSDGFHVVCFGVYH